MKKTGIKMAAFIVAAALCAPVALLAQDDRKDKADKEVKEKKDVQQIIITRKNDKEGKVVVEINGDNVTINGKPLEDYKGNDGDISVRLNKLKDLEFLTRIPNMGGAWSYNGNDNFKLFTEDANKAMLGVTTEKTNEGAEISDVTGESAAEKIGLKEGDIITRVDDKKIENPDDLSAAIKAHKPGDKVTITYLRDKKEQKATAELTKWKGVNVFGTTEPFKMDMGGMDLGKTFPRALTIPRTPGAQGQNWSWSGGTPKLGLSVQDTDDGKGVKVIEVDEESNANKAGIREEDIITEVDGKAVNSTDEMVKLMRESKDKNSVMVKLQRAGKIQNIEVKMPRKIKTADL
jgi:serine protease Do